MQNENGGSLKTIVCLSIICVSLAFCASELMLTTKTDGDHNPIQCAPSSPSPETAELMHQIRENKRRIDELIEIQHRLTARTKEAEDRAIKNHKICDAFNGNTASKSKHLIRELRFAYQAHRVNENSGSGSGSGDPAADLAKFKAFLLTEPYFFEIVETKTLFDDDAGFWRVMAELTAHINEEDVIEVSKWAQKMKK